jgi:Circularly permutated YpsA SLOG family
MSANKALDRAIAAVNGELGYPGRILTGGQRGAAQGALMAARDIGLSTGGIAPKGWRVTLWDGTNGSDPWLAEFGLIEHESADYRDRTMQNVADAEATVWIGEVGEKSQPMTLAIAEDLGARFTCNPTPAALRDWCRRTGIKMLHVAGECGQPDAPNMFNRAYHLIGEAFGGGRGWCIHDWGDPLRLPFAGEQCAIVSVPPGKIYCNEDDAIADCFRLREVGSGFEVGKIYLPRRIGQCSAPQ